MIEAYRLRLMCGIETLLHNSGHLLVAGVDEAGRGCLAGPVVAAAVVMDPHSSALIPGVDDSKRLSPELRTELALVIRRQALAVSSVAIPAETIERINILEATRLAMRSCLDDLKVKPDIALIDAVWPKSREVRTVPVIRGDSVSYSIACASIIAKTERDALMARMEREFPGYGFKDNKGYGSKVHRDALAELGPTPLHRLTFRSVIPRCEA